MKIKSFKIKDCETCLWYQSASFIEEEFCPSHRDKEDQPLEIIKQIKQEQKELKRHRIFFGGISLLLLILMTLFFCLNNYLVSLVWLIYSITPIWLFIDTGKYYGENIKELKSKNNQWIIEYE